MGPGDRPGGCESGAASAPQEPRGAWQQAAWGFGGLEEDGVPVGALRPSPCTARRGTARMGSAVSPGGNASGERGDGGWGGPFQNGDGERPSAIPTKPWSSGSPKGQGEGPVILNTYISLTAD